jgi:hypothetical protein
VCVCLVIVCLAYLPDGVPGEQEEAREVAVVVLDVRVQHLTPDDTHEARVVRVMVMISSSESMAVVVVMMMIMMTTMMMMMLTLVTHLEAVGLPGQLARDGRAV